MTQGTCSIDGCDRPAKTRGWCALHYGRWLRLGITSLPERQKAEHVCSADSCDRVADWGEYCDKHYRRLKKTGTLTGSRSVGFCTVNGCDRVAYGRGWCEKHYATWRRHGVPVWIPPSQEQVFWAKVVKDGPVVPLHADLGPCWMWTGARDRQEYATFHIADEHTQRAFRLAYEWQIGPIPEGLTLDHLCHTHDLTCPGGKTCLHRRCVNPAHAEPVSQSENTLRTNRRRRPGPPS